MFRQGDKRTTNAVTCRELFRSYPPLATSLLSLIKEENANASFNDSLHPALFPLLLLLARLQPLSLQRVQPGDDEVSKLFIDPIINCLGHVHHKVRLVAARALAVLCSGDVECSNSCSSRGAILNKCLERLSFEGPTGASVSHNLDHGVLLAMKYLLVSAPHPEKYLEGKLMKAILHYSTWCNFTFTSPPFCSAIALEVWHIATNRCDNKATTDLGKEDKVSLLEISFKVVRCVEALSIRDSGKDIIGLSDLGKVASKVACEVAFSHIFDASSSAEVRMKHVQIVDHCFSSRDYDVMLHSVKSFKKGIYAGVDRVVADDVSDAAGRRDILRVVSRLAIQCISRILTREKLRAHPPTLRRLSRIALEAMHAFNSMDRQDHVLITDIIDSTVEDLWQITTPLLIIGGYEMTETQTKPENLTGGNGLVGNALELASFAISEMCQRQEETPSGTISRRIELFVNLICQSTHPLSSWKIRYSAAIGAKESGLIQLSTAACRQIGSGIENSRLQLSLHLLELFQDSDEDVRRATGKALSPVTSSLPTVALMNLEVASSHLTSEYSTTEMFNLLLDRLVSLCTGAENKLSTVSKEYAFTIHAPACEDILNLSIERKIFEEEDPNPFEEVSLLLLSSMKTALHVCSSFF